MFSPKKLQLSLLVCTVMILAGCAEWTIHDTESLLFPRFRHSEVVGFVAGLGTTFAALPDPLLPGQDKPAPSGPMSGASWFVTLLGVRLPEVGLIVPCRRVGYSP